MKSLKFSLVKRLIIIPMIVALLCGCAVYFALGTLGGKAETEESAAVYQTQKFDDFSKLEEGFFVGKIISDGNSFDITYLDSSDNSLVLDEASSMDGNIIIFGNGSTAQLGRLRNLKKGDSLKLEIYSNDSRQYTVQSVKYGVNAEDIIKTKGSGMLMLCRSYNDFAAPGEKLYALYTAKEVRDE